MTESAQKSKKNAKNKVNKVKSPDKKISPFSLIIIIIIKPLFEEGGT